MKICFEDLKPGDKFVYGSSLYIVDSNFCVVNFTCGRIEPDTKFNAGVMVTPIRILASDILIFKGFSLKGVKL